MVTSAEWLDQHTDRMLADQRARVETAKLAMTVALAINAGVLAAALQIGTDKAVELWAIVAAFAACSAVLLFVGDVIAQPNVDGVLVRTLGQPDAVRLRALRLATLTVVLANQSIVRTARLFTTIGCVAALASTTGLIVWMVGRWAAA